VHKLILLSLILVTIAVPAWASKDAQPRRGLKKALLALAVFAVFWLLLVKYLYPKLYYPDL
jgi:hypothetical protein